MKTIASVSLSFLMFFAVSVSAQSQEYDILKGSTLISMKGQTYIYEVNYDGQTYDLNVSIKENSAEKGLIFDYNMTNDTKTKGTVYMDENSLKGAHVQNNYFMGGDMKMVNMTTVWLSKQVMEELKTKGETTISPDGGENWKVLKRKYYNYDFPVKFNDEIKDDFAYMYCETDDGSAKYWIQTGGNPLIFKMDLGWTVYLKEYKMVN